MSKRWIYVVGFVASFLVSGIIDGLMGTLNDPFPPTYFPQGILVMFLTFAWCKADVEENSFRMPIGSRLLCALLPPIGVPLHLYRTRPFGRATIALLKGIAVFAAALISYGVTAVVFETVAS